MSVTKIPRKKIDKQPTGLKLNNVFKHKIRIIKVHLSKIKKTFQIGYKLNSTSAPS